MRDLTFLAAEDLTQKDKLVLLTSSVIDSVDPATIADALAMSIPSVRQSLAKTPGTAPDDANITKEVQDAIIEVCQMDRRSMRQSDWKLLAKVTAELVEVGADADEVRLRARNLTRRLRLPVTPGSIDKYWAQLGDRTPFSPGKVYGL